ncbi:hypothetical protein Drose_04390 [Dactylosporangium roseum]|uniref:Uncharacterized protein n=1 Tax=Dactylosporangium roseum TaxID=47989 RepID=A0ABY5ZAY4_9ACTN|nr:hypothetical protein [Dactylosporangium roseum]UWZ37529.1 hypothetical protein Drose_04390 [Dactylosporangium roseum]
MTEIEDPPAQLACSTCNSVVGWLWSARHKVWLAVTNPDPADRDLLRIHRCELFGQPKTWKHLKPVPPEVKRRGVRRARAVLAAQATKRTEKES